MLKMWRRIWAPCLVLAVGFGIACSSSNGTDAATNTARECTYNSDCKDPLICLYGSCVAQCKAKVDCATGYDCVNGGCEPSGAGSGSGGGEPLPENCTNEDKDADETDVDCGGTCAPCDSGKACSGEKDCASKNCANGVCQAATCSDMIQNGGESDVDCGGPACSTCVNGSECGGASDCASGICSGGKCVEPSCADGIKNGDETDVDCGGSCASCDSTKGCDKGSDCTSGVCSGGACQQPSCSDGVKNGMETALDCGGGCDACGTNKTCAMHSDCASGVCDGGTCLSPGCGDMVKNGDETDVDCGGASCADCLDAAACLIDGDCISGACVGNVCAPTYVLTVIKGGAGSGVVEALMDGINCGQQCSKKFVSGKQVTLSALADGGSTFAGWQGGGCSGTGDCSVSMTQAEVVTATFDANQVGGYSWSTVFGSVGHDRVYGVAVSNDQDVAAVGSFQNTIDFGGGPLAAVHQDDIFIMKRDSAGQHLWSRRFGSSSPDYASGVAVDSQGAVLASGRMDLSFSLGGAVLPCSKAAFFAKYASGNGAHLWSRCTGASPVIRRVQVDSADNMIAAGYTVNGSADFGGGAIGTYGSGDAVIVKYKGTDGSYMWSKRYGGAYQDYGQGLAVGANDEVFLSGMFKATMNVGGAGLVSVGSFDIFVTKLSSVGAHLWSKSYGDSFDDVANDVAVGPQGDVVIVGAFNGTVDFGGGPMTSQGDQDIFVVKLKGADGTFLWGKRFGSGDGDEARDVEIDANGEVVVSGRIGSNVDFGAGPLTNKGGQDMFVARFSSAGVVIWANSYGTSSTDDVFGLALDSFGGPVIGGSYYGAIDFGGGFMPYVGAADMFITKLTP